MRHQRRRRKLSVTSEHRKALLRNLVRNLVIYKQIRTTVTKARAASSFADRVIQIAKRGDLHARRLLISKLGCADTAETLLSQIAPQFKERQGGYTRVLRLGYRSGDGSDTAILEFTEKIAVPEKPKKPKKAKKAAPPKMEETAAKPKKGPTAEISGEKKDPSSKAEEEERRESAKKGGFLAKLRKFLKGDDT